MRRLLQMFFAFTVVSHTGQSLSAPAMSIQGVSVIPHVQSSEMRYRREPDFSLGARVQLFLQNNSESNQHFAPDSAITVRGRAPDHWLTNREWAWHDFPSAWTNTSLSVPPGAMTVWSFNGSQAAWGAGTRAGLQAENIRSGFEIQTPNRWISAITFLGHSTNPFPDKMVCHVANSADSALRLEKVRLWLPRENPRVLFPGAWHTSLAAFPKNALIAPGDRGGFQLQTGPLPLTYTAVELLAKTEDGKPLTLWTHLRIKREVFDIGGGWVASTVGQSNALQVVPYLKTLKRMHINTGMHGHVPGYTDNDALFAQYPIKYMTRCEPFALFDNDSVLPRIHAVEFLGEPQYGGGRPVPPMEVWRAFARFQPTRLPTSVTHSEERIWRHYAGLSDFAHYDAYRVCAPAPDFWASYSNRWDGQVIRWGAPLETIGDMTRSLRDLYRPAPVAIWSQGPHDGWGRTGGRNRTSPTPDELRAQAYHGLAARVTSLYWFNLSLKSLLKYPDLIDPITRVGREIHLLEEFYLEGDATHHERVYRNGCPAWDLSVISGPRGALLFALDLSYTPDPAEKVFVFSPDRDETFSWPLPGYLQTADKTFRVNAEGVTTVTSSRVKDRRLVKTKAGPVNVFVLSSDKDMGEKLERRRRHLISVEKSYSFDPAHLHEDLEVLRSVRNGAPPPVR